MATAFTKNSDYHKGVYAMFKKALILCLTFAALQCTIASAMFFEDNPRYLQVGHTDITSSFIDTNSIQSIRYDPPFYIIRATVLTYDYSRNETIGFENNFYYNFTEQTVKAQLVSSYAYDDKGNALVQKCYDNQDVNLCDRNSVNGSAANKAFFNCYNMTFYHKFIQKKDG